MNKIIYFNKKTSNGKIFPVNNNNFDNKNIKLVLDNIDLSKYTNVINDWYILSEFVNINYYTSKYASFINQEIIIKRLGIIPNDFSICYDEFSDDICLHLGNFDDDFFWMRTPFYDNLKILDFDL